LNDKKIKNINLLFTTQYKLFTYQVMSNLFEIRIPIRLCHVTFMIVMPSYI
jgi:hypothetical protein